MQILIPIGLYFLKCTKFNQLILRKIIKNVATRCQILTLKCTKIDFGWGTAPVNVGGAYSAPADPIAGFKGPTSKGRGEEGRGARPVCLLVLTILATGLGWEVGRGEGGEGRGEGLVGAPLCEILNTPLGRWNYHCTVTNFPVLRQKTQTLDYMP